MPTRAILHLDMDAFYASVEMVDHPELQGRPVIVGGSPEGRGVVAAASYEARKFGVHSAMSAAQAHRLCPQGVFLKPRIKRYSEVSRQIFAIFQDYTPAVEPLSIDEAFLDVTASQALFGSATTIGQTIKRRVREQTGLTASVGVAPNKFLAKLASDLEKPDGFVVITPENVAAILAGLPVSRLWGVGKVTERELATLGIYTVRELLACPPEALQNRLGPFGQTLRELAQGIDERPVVVGADSKSVGAETTFARDIVDPRELRRHLDELCETVGRRLRADGMRARTIQLKARYEDFATVTRAVTLPGATAATMTIRRAARELLERRLGSPGRPLRLLGVSATNLERPGEGQGELFPDAVEQETERLDHLLDRITQKFGLGAIRRGE